MTSNQYTGRGPAPDVQRARRVPGHHRLCVRDGVAARAVLRPGKRFFGFESGVGGRVLSCHCDCLSVLDIKTHRERGERSVKGASLLALGARIRNSSPLLSSLPSKFLSREPAGIKKKGLLSLSPSLAFFLLFFLPLAKRPKAPRSPCSPFPPKNPNIQP